MKVYVMTEEDGEYSDYSMKVLGVASSIEDAKILLAPGIQKAYDAHSKRTERYGGQLQSFPEWTEDTPRALTCSISHYGDTIWSILTYNLDSHILGE